MSLAGPEAAPTVSRILVVDDEADIRESVQQLLLFGMENVEVDTADGGNSALESIRAASYDLIICDFKMPGMDGMEFLQLAAKEAPGTPRIMVTAFPDLELAMRAINDAGIENFFTKPLDPEEILQVVRQTLDGRQAEVRRKQALARAMELARRGGAA